MLKRRLFEILLLLVAISSYAWVRQQSARSSASTGQTWLTMDSAPGEYIGQGKAWRLTPADVKFTARYAYGEAEKGVQVALNGPGHDLFSLEFGAPGSRRLSPGRYFNATRFGFQADDVPGMDVSGWGRGNNRLLGNFDVLEIEYGEHGPTRLAIDFVQYGEENKARALKGSIRYHSTFR